MQILILDGFPTGQSPVHRPLAGALSGHQLQHIKLSGEDIPWCKGCFHCWLITPGECVIGGVGNELAREYINSDLVILLSPVVFGSYSSELKKVLDRMIPNMSGLLTRRGGDTRHVRRYHRHPSLLVLGWQDQEDARQQEIYLDLAYRNKLNLMPPSFASGVMCGKDEEEISRQLAAIMEEVGVGK